VDAIQERLAAYAHALRADAIPAGALHAAIVRVIDTLGAVLGGFDDECNRISRSVAMEVPLATGATLLGTAFKAPADMAAFVNGTTSRSAEINDVYHAPDSKNGHPSDVIMPLLAVAEITHARGRDFLASVILAYEIYLRFATGFSNRAFDATNFCCIAVAAGSAKLMGLSESQIAEALSMAAVPNGALNQSRTGHLTMWKSVASGQAGRAGVFAAQLAARGMRGAAEPFTGKHGWCAHIARGELKLEAMGGGTTPFRISDTLIKPRMACLHTLAPILAAEKAAAPLRGKLHQISEVLVEVYRASERAVVSVDKAGGTDPHWNPDSRETADHSVPYCVAATLLDGSVNTASFDTAHLTSPVLRSILAVTTLRENTAFTDAYERNPVEYRCRVTVRLNDGQTVVGETGCEHGDLSDTRSDAKIAAKFLSFANARLGGQQAAALLTKLWAIHAMSDVAVLPPMLCFAG
jgi:2-methylcitrate dehydratase